MLVGLLPVGLNSIGELNKLGRKSWHYRLYFSTPGLLLWDFFRAYRINQMSLKDSSLLPSLALRNWFYVDGAM